MPQEPGRVTGVFRLREGSTVVVTGSRGLIARYRCVADWVVSPGRHSSCSASLTGVELVELARSESGIEKSARKLHDQDRRCEGGTINYHKTRGQAMRGLVSHGPGRETAGKILSQCQMAGRGQHAAVRRWVSVEQTCSGDPI